MAGRTRGRTIECIAGGVAVPVGPALGTPATIARVDPNLIVLLFLLAASMLYAFVLAMDALGGHERSTRDERTESTREET